jgi:tetratricopeptide (TPR) repeat protein
MMKWLMYLVLAALVAGSWIAYSKSGKELDTMRQELTVLKDAGDANDDEKVAKLQSNLESKENERTFTGILLTFLGAGLAGIFVVVTVLPFLAQMLSQGVIGSNEQVEKDAMHDARSLVAQGDYAGAIETYKKAAAADPLNRLPWVEIAKIYKDNLNDPDSAVATIRHALESQEWEINDAAYFLFRLAELYNEVQGDRASAVAIMNQVMEQFPETRHSANARNKLHEWETEDAAGSQASEEAQYLARMKNQNPQG